jgi:hypothetical protein
LRAGATHRDRQQQEGQKSTERHGPRISSARRPLVHPESAESAWASGSSGMALCLRSTGIGCAQLGATVTTITILRREGFLLSAALLVAASSWGCASGSSGSSCGNDFDCGAGLVCASGVCRQSGRTCAASSDCDAAQVCSAGVCISDCETTGCPDGQSCSPTLNQCVTVLIIADGGAPQCTPDTWANFAGSFFTTYCNQCHSWTQQTVSADPNVAIQLKDGYMPPVSPRPSSADVNRILTWIQCGEP